MKSEQPKVKRGRPFGYVMPDEVKEKIRQTTSGKTYSADRLARLKARILAGSIVHVVSDETKLKMSIAKKGRPFTEEHKKALREGQLKAFKDKRDALKAADHPICVGWPNLSGGT